MPRRLSQLEAEEIANRVKGMDSVEREWAIKFFKTSEVMNELDRRTNKTLEIMRELFGILEEVKDNTPLEDMQNILARCKEALKWSNLHKTNHPNRSNLSITEV